MARRSRDDSPGSWHHVINRGIARRPLFDDRHDVRYFLSRLAREARRGRLEIHAWCCLSTHFHLLVRSPQGQLSEALRRIQNDHSRAFNRRHRRDGALTRGRFYSKPVRSFAYRWSLVRYIDDNPVQAGLAGRAADYPYCSAHHYARPKGPVWCTRTWIEQVVTDRVAFLARASDSEWDRTLQDPVGYRPEHYELAFPSLGGPVKRWIERRIACGAGSDALDQLLGAPPARVRRWLESKARLADGAVDSEPLCDVTSICDAMRIAQACVGPWPGQGKDAQIWRMVEVGLLRDLACASWREVAMVSRTSQSTAFQLHEEHARRMASDLDHAQRVATITAQILSGMHGSVLPEMLAIREYGGAPVSSVIRQRDCGMQSARRMTEETDAPPYSSPTGQ